MKHRLTRHHLVQRDKMNSPGATSLVVATPKYTQGPTATWNEETNKDK